MQGVPGSGPCSPGPAFRQPGSSPASLTTRDLDETGSFGSRQTDTFLLGRRDMPVTVGWDSREEAVVLPRVAFSSFVH